MQAPIQPVTATEVLGSGEPTLASQASGPRLPDGAVLGPFRIGPLLGEGGMGAVYLAEQTTPIRRRVALKLLSTRRIDLDQLARFEIERQALAQMSHPGVAQIFDAGATAEGTPWFAMELVEGVALDQHLRTRRLPVEARLQLLSDIGRAVAHAHRKGVLHCDLKPSNILVAQIDGAAHPKLIDFGIARALGEDRQHGASAGTLAYMSPEQLAGGVGLDTRSDVFALGVLLWECLHGERFRPWAQDRGIDFASACAHAQEEDERRRQHPLAGLPRGRSRELHALLCRALAPDREQRLESAEQFSDELRRWLQHLPLESMSDSASYRMRCFVRRHRVLSTTVLAALLVILGLIGVLLRQLEATREQRDLAEQAAGLLVETFRAADPYTYPEGSITARELLQLSTERIARQPIAPALRLRLLGTLADVQFRSELHSDALATLAQARSLAGEVDRAQLQALQLQEARVLMFAERSDEADALLDQIEARLTHPQRIESRLLRAEIALWSEAPERAEQALDEVEAWLRLHPDRQHDEPRFRLRARLLQSRGRVDEAVQEMQKALAASEELHGPDDPRVQSVLSDLASLFVEQGLLEEAERLRRRVAAATERSFGTSSISLAIDLDNLGVVLRERGGIARVREALELHRRALEIFRLRAGPASMHTGISASNFASVLADEGDFAAAAPLFEEAQQVLEAALGSSHSTTAVALHNRARNLLRLEQAPAASALLDRAGEILRERGGQSQPRYRIWLTTSCARWAALGDPARARADCVLASEHPTAGEAPDQERRQLQQLLQRLDEGAA